MYRLLTAVLLLSSSVVYAQKPAEKPAAPAAPAPAAPAAKPAAGAPAAAAPAGEAMTPPKAGPETEALKPFAKSATSTGAMAAGALGPNSPETPTKGKFTCKWILNNLWVACDIDDTMGTGKTAMKWGGHWVFGYDFGQKGYRGTMVDTMGNLGDFKGTLDGAKLTWESVGEMKGPPGTPTKQRMVIDGTDPKGIKLTEEVMVGGKWTVHYTSTHKASGGK